LAATQTTQIRIGKDATCDRQVAAIGNGDRAIATPIANHKAANDDLRPGAINGQIGIAVLITNKKSALTQDIEMTTIVNGEVRLADETQFYGIVVPGGIRASDQDRRGEDRPHVINRAGITGIKSASIRNRDTGAAVAPAAGRIKT